jgi:molybdenum cofactor cytidylyltransferase
MVTAVVLAAGASTRMGVHKLLLPLGGEPIVRRSVRQVCEAGADDVLVVLGREATTVSAALDGLPCRLVTNTDFETGLGSSFRVAVDAVAASDAALFVLADQPFVTSADHRLVLDAWRDGAPLIVSARFGEVTAPPQLFARALFPELARLSQGAKPVLERHADAARHVALPSDHLVDIDTPEDYARARALLEGGRLTG